MKIIKEIKSENCFDDSFVKEYKLSDKVSSCFVDFLKSKGELFCLHTLDNPFFSYNKEGILSLKGVVNDDEIRVIYIKDCIVRGEVFLKNLFEEHNSNNCVLKN